MDANPIEYEDLFLLGSLIVLLGLFIWVIYVFKNLDSSRIDKVCSTGPSVSFTKGQLSDLLQGDIVLSLFKSKYGSVPATDLKVTATFKCGEDD